MIIRVLQSRQIDVPLKGILAGYVQIGGNKGVEPLTTSISVYLFKEWPPKVVMAFSGWFKCRSWSKVKPNQRRERHNL